MDTAQTHRVMAEYFAALGSGQFTAFFTDDVTWTTVESGEVVQGAGDVQEAIVGLHARMSDMQTRRLTISQDAAYIEGTCASLLGSPSRVDYCVAYDLREDRIASMRAYGALAAFMASEETR